MPAERLPAAADRDPSRSTTAWAAAVAIAVLIVFAFTIRDYGLTTDEPRYIENNRRIVNWFFDFATIGVTENLTGERLQEGWYYARPDSKNLPLVSVVSTLGYWLIGQWDSPPAAYRWGNALVFAATCGVVFHWMAARYSHLAALTAVAALLGTPRLWANANLLSIDPLVGCFWMLSTWALSRSIERSGWPILFGVFCGMGMASKPTFWFALPGWILWLLWFHRGQWRRTVAVLLTVVPLTMLVFTPMWWRNPVLGFFDYLHMLRTDAAGWKIDVYYLGEIYQAEGFPPLPWTAIPVMTFVTTPVWVLVLSAVGIVAWFRSRRCDAVPGLWLLGAVTLPLVCMLPGTPAHDGLRLYRTAFFFGPLFAGFGLDVLRRHWWAPRAAGQPGVTGTTAFRPSRRHAFDWAAGLLIAVLSAWPLVRSHPAELSYYNALVGGFQNAAAIRELPPTLPERHRPLFEVSYWWDLMSPEALAAMQNQLPRGARLWVYPADYATGLLQDWGQLRGDVEVVPVPAEADYLLFYGRMGRLLDPRSVPFGSLFLHGQPVWEHRIDGIRVAALFSARDTYLRSGRIAPQSLQWRRLAAGRPVLPDVSWRQERRVPVFRHCSNPSSSYCPRAPSRKSSIRPRHRLSRGYGNSA